MMTRMKDRDGNYDFGAVDELIEDYLHRNKGAHKIELSYPTPVPHDLGHAMANLFIEVHGVDIVIVDQPTWAVSLVGVKAIDQ